MKEQHTRRRESFKHRLLGRFPLIAGALKRLKGYDFQLVPLDYRVEVEGPRWGYGKPDHSVLLDLIAAGLPRYADLLDFAKGLAPQLHAINAENVADTPRWGNGWFDGLDAIVLYALVTKLKPRRYFEIGSGHSTKFARLAVSNNSLSTKITSVDPNPRSSVDMLCDRVIRSSLENLDLDSLDELEPGDILFFDGSHRSFMNTDVTVFFLDVLPRLPKGVLVHIHDVYLPSDYPSGRDFFNEAYLLAALLIYAPGVQVVMPNAFVMHNTSLARHRSEVFRAIGIPEDATAISSFWFEL